MAALAALALCRCGDASSGDSDGGPDADSSRGEMARTVDAAIAMRDLPSPSFDSAASPEAGAPARAQPATQAAGRFLDDSAVWYQDATSAQVASDSSAITQWMVTKAPSGGWGTGRMRVDFSIVAVEVPPGTPRRTYAMSNGFYYSPDCDTAPIPLVPGGAVEGDAASTVLTSPWSGYDCAGFANGDDCHILLVARAEKRLYEVYHGTVDGSGAFTTGCLALWDTTFKPASMGGTNPPPDHRGAQCSSADAAGFPIAPLLFTVEEVKAGTIDHAIRFILPNSMIRMKSYVAPATHGTNTTGPATSGPYGFHMRLRAGYPVSTLSPAAQVVARALQKYGMYMADGGNIALTAQSDVLSTTKWSDVGFDTNSLSALKATDFEVIDHGPPVAVTFQCQRTPIAQ